MNLTPSSDRSFVMSKILTNPLFWVLTAVLLWLASITLIIAHQG